MPRVPLQIVRWSADDELYVLAIAGRPTQQFRRDAPGRWQAWLAEQTAFTFHGRVGQLHLRHEPRARGGRYWYAYTRTGGQSRKQYLGHSAALTLARLEQLTAAAHAALAHASDSAQRTLLASRLAAPGPSLALVPRERLFAQLDAMAAKPLTLVSAGAGWGKTALLSTWAARHPDRPAWLALDPLDNDPARFVAALIAAIRSCRPTTGAHALALLHAPAPPPAPTIVAALLADLAVDRAAPLLLVIDDYHHIADQTIHAAVALLVERLPPQLRLVLASRSDPALPLARWRVAGLLAELRVDTLRFTADEVAAFFQQALNVQLAAPELRQLEQRTEGWAAGLRLTALALQQQPDPVAAIAQLTGSHQHLLDYLQTEVLRQQSPAVQRFLLHSAVLTRLHADLCAAVTGEAASQAMLAALVRANLFIVPLDDQRQWYRLHDLFRDALLAQLQADEPELVPQLHWRAMAWYAAHDATDEAVNHAFAAGDGPAAVGLIERAAPQLWLAGRAKTVLGWVEALPDALLARHALLCLDAALRYQEPLHLSDRAAFTRAEARIEQLLGRIAAGLRTTAPATDADGSGDAAPDPALVTRRIQLLRALLATRQLLDDGEQGAMQLLLTELEQQPEDDELRWQVIPLALRFWLATAFHSEGQLRVEPLLAVRQRTRQSGDALSTIRVMLWLAFGYERAGQLRHAERECRAALALIERAGIHTHLAGHFYRLLFAISYAWNRLDVAADALDQLLRIGRCWQHVDLLSYGQMLRVRLALLQGDRATAADALQQAEQLAHGEGLAMHRSWVQAPRVDFWLASGDLQAARAWADSAVDTLATGKPHHTLTLLLLGRVQLALGQYAQTRDMIERFDTFLDWPDGSGDATQLLAQYLVALYHTEETAQARELLGTLLALTEPESQLRVYLDLGEPMRRTLRGLLVGRGVGESALAPSALAFGRRLLAVFAHEVSANGAALLVPHRPTLADGAALTQREREVLRLLIAGASNRAIGEELVISLATVKKHVANLLHKLGVARRTEAIALWAGQVARTYAQVSGEDQQR